MSVVLEKRGTSIYIHIPFCASRCIYCSFFSTVGTHQEEAYVDALCREMELRGDYLPLDHPVDTIYLGGGTPSQLSPTLLHTLMTHIGEKLLAPRNHGEHPREITIECNPDDMSTSYAQALASIGFNRVSMGVQTFDDERLRFLHRRHDAHQAAAAMQQLHAAGIDNISIDLIFGFPGQRLEQWEADIERALELRPTHLSAYGLSYEEGTPLERLLRDGTISAIDEEESLRMYDALCDRLQDAGYEHYELSNFALPGYRSLHNSGYWQGVHYLGLGAAAHSYDGVSRQWNVGDLSVYIDSIAHDMIPMEREVLDQHTRWDDLMVTALRTCEGIDLSMVREEYGIDYLRYLLDAAQLSLSQDLLKIEDDHLRLTRRGIPVSDMVMADFMRSIGD